MMRHFFFIATFLISFIAFDTEAQTTYTSQSTKAIKLYEAGSSEYRLKNLVLAEDYFLKAIEADSLFQEPYLVLAELYWDQGKLPLAISMYNRGLGINPMYFPSGFVNKGKLEIKTGNYETALESFQKYLSLEIKNTKKITEAKRGIEQVQFALHAIANPVPFEPIKLSENVNSSADEYWPALSADEQTLIITRLLEVPGTEKFQEDFYFSTAENNSWLPAQDAGAPLNTPDNEGAQSISANGRYMVYTVCNRPGIFGRCDLFFSEKTGDIWSEPLNMGKPINTASKETQPSLSADGRTVYFVSDRPGGFGSQDIWMSEQNASGQWSEPVNLGDSINTSGNESSPFIHHDNRTLYFSSTHHLGLGGSDVFRSVKHESGAWSSAVNLGYPINTYGEEIGFIVNARGNKAYYSSNRDSLSGRDIYEFELYEKARPLEVSYLKGKVFDAQTLQRLKASFELFDLSDGKLVTKSFSDSRSGEFLICIPSNRNYMLNVSKNGYLFYSENFSLEGVFQLQQPYHKDIPLRKISVGSTMILRNVFFDTDSYQLKPASAFELNKVLQMLVENPTLRIEISGHTDNQGSETYNQQLSEKRASSVRDYLVSKGISQIRLSVHGYGFSQPVDSNDTPEGRANNRRTELKILE
ncbi:MAG: PD40 domain-containing protein [Bacteroidota bacterium]|nr:MAG: PD40 domain-containing protein [Bacteroidota bacterium]